MGYDYIAFGRFHFEDDLQYVDAVPMLERLMKLSSDLNLEFGVKITNTFPVDVKANELPSEEMYMSGKALFPLSIALAAKLSREFDGKAAHRIFRRRRRIQHRPHRWNRRMAGDGCHDDPQAWRISETAPDGAKA